MKRIRNILIMFLLLIVLAVFMQLLFPFSHCLFDKEKWLAVKIMNDHEYAQNKSEPRKCMMSDLSWRYLKKGMPESEVIQLLGVEERRVFYTLEDIKEFADIKLPLTRESHEELNRIMKPRQPYPTVEIFISEKNESTHTKLDYNIGQSFSDVCSLDIRFNKQGLLTEKHFSCN